MIATAPEPKTEKVRAIDVKPYRWALWCTVEGSSKPFANEICIRKWSDDGEKIIFMLDSHNFLFARPDEELELIPIPNPSFTKDEEDEKRMAERPHHQRCQHCGEWVKK
jgi:hypothetical protein